MKKKASKMPKKGLKFGFLNNNNNNKNNISRGKSASSSSSVPGSGASAAYISELERLLRIRNDFMKIRTSTDPVNHHGFIADEEREAFFRFHDLIDNAAPDVLSDPKVIKLIQQADRELQRQTSSSASSESFEPKKRQHIEELKRLLQIRNECVSIRKARNRGDDDDDDGFVDDREREAFAEFNALFENAEPGLIFDPDVMEVIEEFNDEGGECVGVGVEELGARAKSAKEEFVMGLGVGEEVRIIGGRNIGKKGKILEVREEDDIVSLRFLNGEEAVVWVGNVASLGSVVEDMCLMKLMGSNSDGKEKEEMELMELIKNLNVMAKGQSRRK